MVSGAVWDGIGSIGNLELGLCFAALIGSSRPTDKTALDLSGRSWTRAIYRLYAML